MGVILAYFTARGYFNGKNDDFKGNKNRKVHVGLYRHIGMVYNAKFGLTNRFSTIRKSIYASIDFPKI